MLSEDYEQILKMQEWNNWEMCDIMKRPNLHIIGIEKGEESQDNTIDQIFNRIIEENFPKLKKRQTHTNTRST